MAGSANSINIPGRHGAPGEVPTFALTRSTYDDLYVARVVLVKPENMTMDVEFIGVNMSAPDIPMLMPGMGPSSMIGSVPEKNSLVLLLQDGDHIGHYYPIAYLPPDLHHGRSYGMVERTYKEDTADIDDLGRVMPSRMRHMAEGDVIMASSGGSEVYLDTGVEIHDGFGNELRIRQGDGSLMATSRNNYMFANGVWRGAGLIQRNSLVKNDQQDMDIEAQKVVLSDGREATYVGGNYIKKDDKGNIIYDEMYVEYRLDVEDTTKPHLPANDINSEGNYTLRSTPKATFVLGNMVGNNPGDLSTYGKFLAPRFIEGNNLKEAAFALSPLSRDGRENQYKTKGVAWGLGFSNVSFLGADKEGAVHRYMGKGSGGSNRGWSMTTVATGGRRDTWGADGNEGMSWSGLFKGGIAWSVGKTNGNFADNVLPWGINIKSAGSTFISHGDSTASETRLSSMVDSSKGLTLADVARYGRIEKVYGHARDEVSGDYELRVAGNYVWNVGGKFSYRVQGNFGESVFGDRSISTTATFAVNSTAVNTTTGSRTEKLTTGDDNKMLLLGSDITLLAAGFQTTTIGTGGISNTVAAGNFTNLMAAGNFAMNITAGNAVMNTAAGSMSFTTAGGPATVGGTAVTLAGQATIVANAPMVSLGIPATLSPAITMLSHLDYVTGLPLKGSATVMASV